jgi:transposase-like protein
MVQKMTGPNAISAGMLSKQVDVSQTTLSKWLRNAGIETAFGYPKKASVNKDQERQIKTAPRKKAKRSAADVKNIKALEKEVKRKDKALAETAALLVLKKKSSRSGGTRTTTPT